MSAMNHLLAYKLELPAFESLVVPIDFGEVGDRALETSAALARRAPLQIHLATAASPGLDPHQDETDLVARASRLGVARADVDLLQSNDVATALSLLADTLPQPLFCIATHGRTALGEAILGSTTDALLRQTGSAALVIGPHADASDIPATLSICVDPCGTSPSVVTSALAWRQTFGGRLELIEVVEPLASASGAPGHLVQLGVELGAAVRTVASHDPAQALIDHAINDHVLLVLASHRRHGLARAVLGSVTWEVIQRSPTPVLVIPST